MGTRNYYPKTKRIDTAVYFYIGIILATFLFGIGHLPAVAQTYGELSALLVVRTVLLNGLLGLWFGYLYWKKGLE
ncbi:CPBP family glutamic-type intramembrane protease [Pseudogracilibacillus sp. SO30301A]|uniref:CPBP family glutamic-type intramembrane protease n=1 Tax=Pseudogracilibacillus sp. SO30301A TaxID=3098291 RepID=UPI003FA6E789